MSPQEDLECAPLVGQVVAKKNGDHFRVKLENGRIVMARLSGRMRNDNVQVGDKVVLETSSYDPSEGQIICRTR